MRFLFWVFAALIGAALVANLALVSARMSQNAEDALHSRVAVASAGLRTQVELLDLRTSPRLAAFSPELIEATRPPADAAQPAARPDERALRAAFAGLQPDPDLLVIANAHGAAVSRRGKAAVLGEDPARLPLVRVALESGASPQFVTYEGALYRASAAKIPGNAAVVVTGALVDDNLAAQLRAQVDADVSFFNEGKLIASSLGADDRAAIAAWATKPPGIGFGELHVVLPVLGTTLSDQFPLGAPRAATRASILALAPTVQAVVSVPASAHFAWLAHYQATYLLAWALFLFVAFVIGLFAGRSRRERIAAEPGRDRESLPESRRVAGGRSAGLDPDLPPGAPAMDEPQLGPLGASASAEPMWSAEPLAPPVPLATPERGSLEVGRELPPVPTPIPTPSMVSPLSTPKEMRPAAGAQAAPSEDVDEAHLRETFDKFMALRAETGESGNLSYERFAAKLRQNREQLLARGNVRTVRFTVYKKDGKAAIKASAVR
jgi:hypothetical protein